MLRPKWTRAAKATARFMLLIGGLVSFGVSFVMQMRADMPSAWTAMGLLLVCIAALFYDPENPPNQTVIPSDDTHDRRHGDPSD